MLFGMIRDGMNICLYMGKKPLMGMQLPAAFTFFMLTGVWFNNLRRHTTNPSYNKIQNDAGIDADH